jgi:GTP cyclohydrolase I
MYVCLPHHFKGTHMSRFVEILEEHEREITVETFQVMLREMVERLEAEEGHIEMMFPYFIEKKAPVSGVKSLMDYEVTFMGEIKKGKPSFTMKVVVPVTSLCPCDNPKFVEDMVRDVAAVLNLDERIEAYVVESENFESIHNHSAYALIEKNKRAR